MKKFVIGAIALLLSLNYAFAQDSNKFTFKGIPIEGSPSAFVQKLVAQGYKTESLPSGIQPNIYKTALNGLFFNNEAAIVLTTSNNEVTSVLVGFFHDKSYVSDDDRITLYNNIRSGLEAKYNNDDWIIDDSMDYDEDASLLDVKYEMSVHGKSYYYRVFDKESGNAYIVLYITKDTCSIVYMNPNKLEDIKSSLTSDL